MPLRMDDGWNQIQFNLADFTKRAYGTNYVETLRVQVHANCRLRRIYFSDRLYSEEELPPEFKLYLPMQQVRDVYIWTSSLFVYLFISIARGQISPCIVHNAEIMKISWEDGIGATRWLDVMRSSALASLH
jgi:hypothetical protein